MTSEFQIQITQGRITVQAISGKIEPSHFALYLGTREKYPSAEVICTGLVTQVELFSSTDTIRPSADGQGYVPIRADEPTTLVELPGDWEVGVSVSKCTVCIMGVKRPGTLDEIPFTEAPRKHFL